jgi:hypothetical protein
VQELEIEFPSNCRGFRLSSHGEGPSWLWMVLSSQRSCGASPIIRKATRKDFVCFLGLKKRTKTKWRRHVANVAGRLAAALEPEYLVLAGGNVRHLKELPEGRRELDNANSFIGVRLWQQTHGKTLGSEPLAKGNSSK